MTEFLASVHPLSMLALMFLLHFYADFNLQLQSGMDKFKQKKWWDDQIPKDRKDLKAMYGYDYMAGIVCHGMFWALAVCLPLLSCGGSLYAWQSIGHGLMHSSIDNAKANKMSINLITDQTLHAAQILAIWATWMMCKK